jgi:hypothetical protein
MPKFQSEHQLQAYCFQYAHNHYPQTRKLLCYNLNNSKNEIDGNRNKALGLQKGRSDMVLYFNGKATMLEFKMPNEKQTPGQVTWEKAITDAGFDYFIIESFEQFIEVLQMLTHQQKPT